jgi:methylsterol monooxygenase
MPRAAVMAPPSSDGNSNRRRRRRGSSSPASSGSTSSEKGDRERHDGGASSTTLSPAVATVADASVAAKMSPVTRTLALLDLVSAPGDMVGFYALVAALYALASRYGPDLWAAAEAAGVSETALGFALTTLVPCAAFYVYGAALFALDMWAPAWLRAARKVQPDHVPSLDDYWRCFKVTLRSWALGIAFGAVLAWGVRPLLGGAHGAVMPTPAVFIRDLAVTVVIEELMFFYSHRALHQPPYYAKIHKFHHQFTAPFGIAAVYAHPIEHMLSNVIPVGAGPVLMGSHPVTACIWTTVAIINTMTVHSGYRIPLMPSPSFHDWHHERFNENFGVLGVLDGVYGTCNAFIDTMRQRQRAGAAAKKAPRSPVTCEPASRAANGGADGSAAAGVAAPPSTGRGSSRSRRGGGK